MKLGDMVEKALSSVGITEDRVKEWLGDCCCKERKEKLNRIGLWARRILRGNKDKAEEYLNRILKEGE